MKKVLSLVLTALMTATVFAVDIVPGKIYKLSNRNDNTKYVKDNGGDIIAMGALDDASYWRFIPTGNAGCYYVQNVKTGRFAQECSTETEKNVTMGTNKVEYRLVDCSAQEGADCFGLTSTNEANTNFTAGCIGWNWKADNTVQTYAAAAGSNHRSFWKVTEAASPYVGIAPAEGEVFFYNVATGKWIQNNNGKATTNRDGWNTAANMGAYGRPFMLEKHGDIWYLNPQSAPYHMGGNYGDASLLYLDGDIGNYDWTFEKVENGYIIKNGDNKRLGVRNENGTLYCEGDAANEVWQIVTRQERINKLAEATPENPQDVSWMMVNPTLMNNDKMSPQWANTHNGGGDAWNDGYRPNRIWETWGYNSMDMSQTINVPAGKYSITAKAVYSPTANDGCNKDLYDEYAAGGDATVFAGVYANDAVGKLASIYSFTRPEPIRDVAFRDLGGVSIVDGLWQMARAMDEDDAFKSAAAKAEVTDGTLKVGIKSLEGNSGRNWVIIGSFNLQYEGPVTVPVVSLDKTSLSLGVDDTSALTATVQNLANATLVWTSSDEDVATVDAEGNVTGVSAGKATITCTIDGYEVSTKATVTVFGYTRHDINGIGYAAVNGGAGYSDNETWTWLCDEDPNTKYCGATGNAWVVIMASEPVAATQYSIVTGGDTQNYWDRNPKAWKLEGSNDGVNWTGIDNRNEPYLLPTLNKEECVFKTGNTTAYKYFKFTTISGRSICSQFSEIWINEQNQEFGEPVLTEPTCNKTGSSVATSNLGVSRTMLLAETNEHVYGSDDRCTVCKKAATLLLADGQSNAYNVKFQHALKSAGWDENKFGENWKAIDFDDSEWGLLKMPVGTYGVKNTQWMDEYNAFWMRREFYIDDLSALDTYTLKTLHDDCYRVYINGQLVTEDMRSDNAWTTGTDWISTVVDNSVLREGKNVLAIYIQQNWGGAYCDFSLSRALTSSVDVTIGETGYATFVAPFNVGEMPTGLQAKAAQICDGYIHLENVEAVPAGEAVVLGGEQGSYTITRQRGTIAAIEDNDLQAATEAVTATGSQYILGNIDGKAGFAKATPNTTIAAGKGYLIISAETKAFLPFGDDNATAIEGVATDNGQATEIFNLAGQRVQKAQKGVFIQDGKKIMK